MKSGKPQANYYQQESERLLFCELSSEHISFWKIFFPNNPSLRFVGMDQLTLSDEEKASSWIQRQIERKSNNSFGQLAIIEKRTNQFIGVGGIIERKLDEKPAFEISYSLLPSSQGQGFATELAIHFKEFAFTNIDTTEVISIIHKENEASMNVARKNGMRSIKETQFMGMPVFIFSVSKPEN